MTDRHTKTIILLVTLGTGIVSIIASLLAGHTEIPGGVTEIPIREALLLEKGGKSLRPTVLPENSVSYSNIIHDVTFNGDYVGPLPYVEGIVADPHGRYSHFVRFKLSVEAMMSFDTTLLAGRAYSIRVTDRHGLPLYRKTDRLLLPAEEVLLEPGLYVMHLESAKDLKELKFQLRRSRNSGARVKVTEAWRDTLSEIHITLDGSSHSELRRIVDITMNNPGPSVITMPSVRVKATLEREDGQKLPARVGLSGRTREHLQWFPSIDVKLTGQGALRGLNSFKLYRLETKSGLADFVFLSTLADMDFFVPRHDVVRLYINGEKSGLYMLMETSLPTVFATQRRLEGNIIGTDPEALFPDYPFGARLVNRYFHNIAGSGREDASRSYPVSSGFSRWLDVDDFARYLGFATIYLAGHGLGVDDLRFYEDPTTGKISPIPRDLNPGLWNLEDHNRTFRTHFAWHLTTPPYTVWPVQWLRPNSQEFNKQQNIFREIPESKTATGLTDIHYSVPLFLSAPENLKLANKYLQYFANSDSLRRIITNRMIRALRYVDGEESGISYIKEQLDATKAGGVASLAGTALEQMSNGHLRFQDGMHTYRWNIRTAPNLDPDLRPSFFAPVKHGLSVLSYQQQLVLAFLCERNIHELIRRHRPAGGSISYATARNRDDRSLEALDIEQQMKGMHHAGYADDADITKNVVTYLDTLLDNDRATILFLVRNATDVRNYVIEMRDSRDVYQPLINAPFRFAATVPSTSTRTNEILLNRFSVGETLRLLVFEIPLSESPLFYRLLAPAESRLLVPAYMYLPARTRVPIESAQSRLPPWFIGGPDGYHVNPGQQITIDSAVVLPQNANLTIREGVIFIFKPAGSITVTGDLRILGSKANPVIFKGEKNQAWNGLFVSGSKNRQSRLIIKNTVFDNVGNFPKTVINGRLLNSGLSFIHVDADLEDVQITNSKGEDAINFVSSTAILKHVHINNAVSDAIDLDFTDAIISNLNIEDIHGDGLDVSNSLVSMSSSRVTGAADKCLSVGEISHVMARRTTFAGCGMGIANKDQSRIEIAESKFEENDIAISEYIKKRNFGRPTSMLTGNSFVRNGQDYQWLGYHR